MSPFKRFAAAAALVVCAGGASAASLVYAHDFIDHGTQASPGSVGAVFTASAQPATLKFLLKGYATLDGANDFSDGLDYGDYFHLVVNGQEILTAGFVMGGGGENLVLLDLAGAKVRPHTNGFDAGGHTEVSVPIQLVEGRNTIEWLYTSAVPQGLGDEGWALGQVKVMAAGQ